MQVFTTPIAASAVPAKRPRLNTTSLVCKPIQQAPSQCECAHNRTSRPDQFLPRCAPSALCVDDPRGRSYWNGSSSSSIRSSSLVGASIGDNHLGSSDERAETPGRRLWHTKPAKLQRQREAEQREIEQAAELQRLLALPRPPPPSSGDSDGGTTFLITYGHNASRVRYWYAGDPFRSYLNQMRLLCRLVLSLHAAGTRLPISLLLSGERHAGFEAALTAKLGVSLLDADDEGRHRIRVPKWASRK